MKLLRIEQSAKYLGRCMAMVCSVALNHVKEAWTADCERPTREKARARKTG